MTKDTETTTAQTIDTTAQSIINLMADIGGTEEITTPADFDFTKTDLVAIPKHRTIQDLTAHRRAAMEYLKPARRRGTAHLTDMDSLIAWAERFKGNTSALFADTSMTEPRLTCIADYHAGGTVDVDNPQGDPTARHCHHRAVYDFPLSDEWTAWTNVANDVLDKNQLGEFIETNAKDIQDPTPAIIAMKESDKNEAWENRMIATAQQIEGKFGQLHQLLAMSKTFQVYEKSDLSVTSNRDTGEASLEFKSEHNDAKGKPLKIPNLLMIAIPVFEGGVLYRMPVRFRYRKRGAEIGFLLRPYNPERAFKSAFNEAITTATTQTNLPLFKGTPEN